MGAMETLVLILDLVGTFVFAPSGAMLGVRRRLDLFGVLVLSFAAATAGGITRDLLIGATPPAALSDWRYPVTSLAAGVVTFFRASLIEKLHHPVRLFDAMGLALFAVAGTQKALEYGIAPPMAAAMGMLTGIGGGIARDVLLAQIVALGHWLQLPPLPCALVGALVCFGLRMAAITFGWHLPVALQSGGDGEPPGPLQ